MRPKRWTTRQAGWAKRLRQTIRSFSLIMALALGGGVTLQTGASATSTNGLQAPVVIPTTPTQSDLPKAVVTQQPALAAPTTLPGANTAPETYSFSDVYPSDSYYPGVMSLANRNPPVISGYADGTFHPGASATRGQICKIIVNAMGWAIDTSGGPHFSDVPTNYVFYPYIETAWHHGIISGYADGTFHPGDPTYRGQFMKILTLAMGIPQVTWGGPHLSDVPTTDTYYSVIEGGYFAGAFPPSSCGSNCYSFSPYTYITRGDLSQYIYRVQYTSQRRIDSGTQAVTFQQCKQQGCAVYYYSENAAITTTYSQYYDASQGGSVVTMDKIDLVELMHNVYSNPCQVQISLNSTAAANYGSGTSYTIYSERPEDILFSQGDLVGSGLANPALNLIYPRITGHVVRMPNPSQCSIYPYWASYTLDLSPMDLP